MLTERDMDLGCLVSGWSRMLRRNPGRRGSALDASAFWIPDRIKEETVGDFMEPLETRREGTARPGC